MDEQKQESRELTATDIIDADDVVIERVEVPEWGGHIYVRSMEAATKERYIDSIRKTVGKGKNATTEVVLEKSSAKLVSLSACNKNGELLFNLGMVNVLAKKNSAAMQRVVNVAARLNGLSDDADEDSKNDSAGATEQIEDSNTD